MNFPIYATNSTTPPASVIFLSASLLNHLARTTNGISGILPFPRTFEYPSGRRSRTGTVSFFSPERYSSRFSSGTRDQSWTILVNLFWCYIHRISKVLNFPAIQIIVELNVPCQGWQLASRSGCLACGSISYRPFRSNLDGTYPCWFGGDVDHQQDHDHLDACGAFLHDLYRRKHDRGYTEKILVSFNSFSILHPIHYQQLRGELIWARALNRL